jgi:toxin ParE1/3/4
MPERRRISFCRGYGRNSMAERKHIEVRLLRTAEKDLDDISIYIFQDDPIAADQILTSFENAFDILGSFPEIGKIPEDADIRILGFRYLVTGRYLIFYKVEAAFVLVYRILHAARDYLSVLEGTARAADENSE